MRRRHFLGTITRGAAFCSVAPLAGCAWRRSHVSKQENPALPPELISELETEIRDLLTDCSVPGLGIGMITNGHQIWRGAFGVKDAATRTPVDNDTVFEAASMSKPVFAYAALKLGEKGTIALDTPLAKYAAERFLEGDSRLDLVTARHVLSHTTGFQNWRGQDEPLKIQFTPGEKYHYSGEGYYYLQSVVTQLKGQVDRSDCAEYEGDLKVCATDIDAYLRKNLLEPFGMRSSGYVWNDIFEKQTAQPHDEGGKSMTKKKPRATDAARYASAGGLHTTATDYTKFLGELLQPKPSDEFRLRQDTLTEMFRPHVKTDYPFPSSWSLGWQISHAESGDLVQHGGDNAGFHSYAVMSLKKKCGCVVMTNGDNGPKLLHRLFSGRNMTAFFSA